MTPLHIAALVGNTETALALIELGADTEAKEVGDRTPLDMAIEFDQIETTRALIPFESDVQALGNDAFLYWHEATENVELT